ncbi:hypothetical protein GCM10011506_19050 [Marivirga lumbricoides]|uniref:Outer membrane protein beta-barrel domain-containing protein n=1 Tax=Marivirga lumbricoides TaxID=1046115 RepID=A0ABQ1M3L2_9BACT|nr:hypothetical protein GCM10011506_19050 [Marivirga lumbricoides]
MVRNLLILSILLFINVFNTFAQEITVKGDHSPPTFSHYHLIVCINKNCITTTNLPETTPLTVTDFKKVPLENANKNAFNNPDTIKSYQFPANSLTIEKPATTGIKENLKSEADHLASELKSDLEKNMDVSSLEKGNLEVRELDLEKDFQKSVNPIKAVHIDRKNLNAVKKVNEKVLHLKKERNSAFSQYFKSSDLEKWYHYFSAFAFIDVVNPQALLTENALGLRWAYSENISLGFSYGIRTQTKVSTDTLLIMKKPFNTFNIFTEFSLFKKIFLRPGLQIIKSENKSTKDLTPENVSIPYLMLGRNFTLNQRHNWYIGSKFNLINNNLIYNQRISIVLGINRKLKKDKK